jgi:hypothetical protein
MLRIDNPHIAISIACYLACLFFPGYYIGERFEPQLAYVLLLMGWLGPLDGHFAWFANPLFLFALLSANRPQRSSILGLIGLVLALSFVFYKKIVISEAPTYSPIVAYGWGYGLWITSLGVLAVGQAFRARSLDSKRIAIASFSTCGLFLTGYLTYYFLGDNSLFAIRSERDREFETRCASAGEHIFKKTNDVTGIFFDPDWQWNIGSKFRENPNFKYIGGVGVIGLGHLNSGHLLFYETRERSDSGSYVKYVLGDFRGTRSAHLESEYAVITDYLKIPQRLNISGATVTIKDRRDNSILATSTFVIENESGRFCGNSRGSFSTSAFMTEVLGLSKKYPSAFK